MNATLDCRVNGKDLYVSLCNILEQFCERGNVLALDFTKAFDALDAEATAALLTKHRWPPQLVHLLRTVWVNQRKFIQYKHHTHDAALQPGVQPQGDPLGPLIMALWVQCGLRSTASVLREPEGTSANTTIYVDDRTLIGDNPGQLQQHREAWAHWSSAVGLLESSGKTEVSGVSEARQKLLRETFPEEQVKQSVRLLGACTYPVPRTLTECEKQRLDSAKTRLRLLGNVGFNLTRFLQEARTFCVTKASWGWVARSPTLAASKSLWTCLWKAAGRIHYSNPWIRCLLWGGSRHLDVTWAVKLVGALLKRACCSEAPWSLSRGTPAAALHDWLVQRRWVLVSPWKWRHQLAEETLDLTARWHLRLGPAQVRDAVGKAQHAVRQGWRAWCACRWIDEDRHETRGLSFRWVGGIGCGLVDWEGCRRWAEECPEAATVVSGATFSPATWLQVRNAPASVDHRCVWGCGQVGTWMHICWQCQHGPSRPRKPCNPFTARFGWGMLRDRDRRSFHGHLAEVRRHLVTCQKAIWQKTHGPRRVRARE